MLTKAPRGTKDVLPNEVYKWNYVEKTFKDVCARYGFKEMRTPTFEHTDLFKRGIGDTTDVVEKQMYSFDDYSGRNITLKPEGTAPVVRSFVENKLYADIIPAKIFYITPCFRYEKPQAGRLREFHQFGIEVFGSDNPITDAEVIALAMNFFAELGLDDLELRINSIGCPTCRGEHREALMTFLKASYDDLCDTCKGRYERNPMRILDCKNETCKAIVKDAPRMLDYLDEECEVAFELVKKSLASMGISFIVDSDIVRGLDYYNKTAFEIISNDIGAQSTVCGGGRYDHLVESVGGPKTSGVGFGLGIERLLLTLDNKNIDIENNDTTDVFIAALGDEGTQGALKLIQDMRKVGIKCQMDLMGRSVKAQFKYADKIKAKYTIVIGENEIKDNIVQLKEMATFNQTEVALDQVVDELQRKLK